MPYLHLKRRDEIHIELAEHGLYWRPGSAGDLNYVMNRVINTYIIARGGPRDARFNEAIAALELAKPTTYPPLQTMGVQDGLRRRGEAGATSKSKLDKAIKEAGIAWAPQDPGEMIAVFAAFIHAGTFDLIDAVGAIECCKFEQFDLYRLTAGHYKDAKMAENGPAYTLDPTGGAAY